MKKVKLKELRHYLQQRSIDELIDDISDLFKKFESVKDYYHSRITPECNEHLVAKYKEIIEKEFFPSRGFGKARLSIAKTAVADYRKASTSVKGLADLMLFYVEIGVEFTNTYGDIDEAFYYSMEGMYRRALKFIFEHDLQDQFISRCKQIVDDTSGIGWGFHDNLIETYFEFFGE